MLGAVVLLGLFAGWRNATAAALVIVYCIVMGAWWRWRIAFPTPVGLMFDATVLGVIYCKRPAFDCSPYESFGDQFRSLWFERSHWDRLVIAMFPIGWLTYVVSFGDLDWWVLWTAALGQYLAAGGETLQASLSTRSAKAVSAPDPPGFMFAPGRETRGYG